MKWPDGKPYYSLNQFYRETFGTKTYKIALDIGTTCPNRDGTLDNRGCIFCSSKGSGDFATPIYKGTYLTSQIDHAIDKAINLIKHKSDNDQFVAYLQSFTNTYGELEYLAPTYEHILSDQRICGLSIATRPDCLNDAILDCLEMLNKTKPIYIELGLQTIHPRSAQFIRRCYPLETYDLAIASLKERGLNVIVHLIANLPYETDHDFLDSVRYVANSGANGIKLQMLHILKGTDLADVYINKGFPIMSMTAYADLIINAIAQLPRDMVVHRITGDGYANDLIAPQWSLNKRNVLNTIHSRLASLNKWQGCDRT